MRRITRAPRAIPRIAALDIVTAKTTNRTRMEIKILVSLKLYPDPGMKLP